MINKQELIISRSLILSPNPECTWASEMVLNPAIIKDPTDGRLHMLFRATGPCPSLRQPNKPLPYPIFLGYAYSSDEGHSWTPDWSKPALAPLVAYSPQSLQIQDGRGQPTTNYANGCIEDPRLFFLNENGVTNCYMTVACRLFPPGPYWENDVPTQCRPDWDDEMIQAHGRAASENVTVNVLYQVNLHKLSTGNYDEAFRYVTHLNDPEKGENRDVIIFPRLQQIKGKAQYLCLHRPWEMKQYIQTEQYLPPSIMLCATDDLFKIAEEEKSQTLLATPIFDWESGRIGASANVVEVETGLWLLSYHGKKDHETGYTQSFMILKDNMDALPSIVHRCPERILVPEEDWEMPGRFTSPVIFITGMILVDQGQTLLVSYGAADEKVGVARLDLKALLNLVRRYDAQGQKML